MVVVKLNVAVVAAAGEHAVNTRRLLVGGRLDLEAIAGPLSTVLLRPAVHPPRLLLGCVLHADPEIPFLWIRSCGGGSGEAG